MASVTVSVSYAAKAVGIGRSTAYRLVADGTWPSIRIGSRIRIPTEDLNRWLAANISGGSRPYDPSRDAADWLRSPIGQAAALANPVPRTTDRSVGYRFVAAKLPPVRSVPEADEEEL